LSVGLTLEQALEKSRRDGIKYGIAVNCGKGFPVQDDEAALGFCSSMKGQPIFVGMQAEGREWTSMFSLAAAAQFDYIFTDAMTWTDEDGRRKRLWIPGVDGWRLRTMYMGRRLCTLPCIFRIRRRTGWRAS
jgi:hypothetical protein